MSIAESIRKDMIVAMKAGNKNKSGQLRVVLAELQKAAKEGRDDEQAVLRRELKRRRESAEIYQKADREDLATPELQEVELISSYLPAQLDDTEIDRIVTEVIAATGATSMRDMGSVIKEVMARTGGQADGKTVSSKVKAILV
jgi:uncharacterized protein YqeY